MCFYPAMTQSLALCPTSSSGSLDTQATGLTFDNQHFLWKLTPPNSLPCQFQPLHPSPLSAMLFWRLFAHSGPQDGSSAKHATTPRCRVGVGLMVMLRFLYPKAPLHAPWLIIFTMTRTFGIKMLIYSGRSVGVKDTKLRPSLYPSSLVQEFVRRSSRCLCKRPISYLEL